VTYWIGGSEVPALAGPPVHPYLRGMHSFCAACPNEHPRCADCPYEQAVLAELKASAVRDGMCRGCGQSVPKPKPDWRFWNR
jgi:hypothetical protein